MRPLLAALAFVGGLPAVLSGDAVAQTTSFLTFVSGTGVDTGTCTRTAPCRNFAYAINQTAAGGQIVALDPAGYAPVTINKAISISGPGPGLAQITALAGGTGVQIAAGTSDAVSLRGIDIVGGTKGINVVSAGSVTIADSVVHGVTNGIVQSGAGSLVVVSTTITGGKYGVTLNAGNVTLQKMTISGANTADVSLVSGRAQIVSCLINNSTDGINQSGGFLVVKSSVITDNGGTGLLVSPTNSSAYLDRTTINGNQIGVNGAAANVIFSYGNNNIAGNGTDGTNALTPVTAN